MTEPSPVYDPLELLTNSRERELPFTSKFYSPLVCSSGGFGLAMLLNFGFRRPIFSGIQKHIAFAAIGAIVGTVADKRREDHDAKRDAILRHYIELHREDFPIEKRKKYGELLEPWVPIR